jgi:hypothetical protein
LKDLPRNTTTEIDTDEKSILKHAHTDTASIERTLPSHENETTTNTHRTKTSSKAVLTQKTTDELTSEPPQPKTMVMFVGLQDSQDVNNVLMRDRCHTFIGRQATISWTKDQP